MTEINRAGHSGSPNSYHQCPKCCHIFLCSFQSSDNKVHQEPVEIQKSREIDNSKHDKKLVDEDPEVIEGSVGKGEIVTSSLVKLKPSDPEDVLMVQPTRKTQVKIPSSTSEASPEIVLETDRQLSDFEIDVDNFSDTQHTFIVQGRRGYSVPPEILEILPKSSKL